MKLKNTFEFVDMGDEIIMVPVGSHVNQVHGVLKINKTGQEIISLMENNTNIEEIVDILKSKYENDREIVEQYVQSVLKILHDNDLIED